MSLPDFCSIEGVCYGHHVGDRYDIVDEDPCLDFDCNAGCEMGYAERASRRAGAAWIYTISYLSGGTVKYCDGRLVAATGECA